MNWTFHLLLTLSGFQTLTGLEGLQPEMILVRGGTFKMGTNTGVPDERPVHKVILSDFYIGKYEVTQKEWREVMGNDEKVNYFAGCDSCPVERVSWVSVMEFLTKLNEQMKLNYRLPTEAEWEYAARGGMNSRGYKYSGSNFVDSIAWRDGNADKRTHPVGMKKPNELGIYDMSGNVWEWCSDWYQQDYYSIAPPQDPQGPSQATFRVMRGGSWFHDLTGLRTTDRDSGDPSWRYGYVGFRLCRNP
jgi:formylglycine-generating enzyme required for sulfatase activity